jgi:GT2 family glycosyltransferase
MMYPSNWISLLERLKIRIHKVLVLYRRIRVLKIGDSLPGRGTLVTITAFMETGFYDTCSFPHYFGDEDFALRAKKLGYSLHVSQKAVLASHVAMTGTGRHNQTLVSFCKSLFSIRSPNQIVRRLRFIWRHCPRRFFVSFALLNTAKVVSAFFRKKELHR